MGYDDAQWFNGVDNYIVADPANFNPSAAGQVVNLKWITNTGDTSAKIIWGYRDQATELIQITQQNDTTVVLQVRGSNNIIETDTITVQAGQYISGTLTYDGVAKTAAFTSNVGTASVSGFGTISASTKLTVGATFGTGSYGSFFDGTIIEGSTNGVDDLTDGTPSGSFVSVGQKRATIPQTADKNWNKYIGLGAAEQGANGYSTFTPVPYGFDGTLASGVGIAGFTLPATAQIGDSFKICVDITSDQSPSCQFRPTAGSASVVSNSVILSVGHNEITLTLTAAGNFVSVSEGDSPSTITARNFTAELISGTAQASVMVTASDANDQIDALGTAISEPRLNTQQLNLFGEGEYSRTPDSASLDLTTTATWEVWGNFYGAAPASTQAILSKTRFSGNERTVDITKSSASADNTVNFTASSDGLGTTIFSKTLTVTDKLSHIVFTYDGATQTMVGYIDGVLTAFSATSGTVQTSLFANTQPYMIGARPSVDPAANYAPFKIGSTKIYNVALTAAEVLTNYETQKSLYGL